MKIQFDSKEISEFLYDYGEIDALSQSMTKLKGIDWNPFDDDGDEHEGVWQESAHNFSLIWDALSSLLVTAEKLVVGGLSLSSQQKHKAVVEAFDRAVRAPFYLEPFDGPLIDMLVKLGVAYFNRVNWGIDEGQELGKIYVEKKDGKAVVVGTS